MESYKKIDPQIPAIEQIDEMYWLPFHAAPRHNYNLSGIHLSFAGTPFTHPYGGPSYIGYETDIYDDDFYPKMYGNIELWSDRSSYIQAEILHLDLGCSYDIDEETAGNLGGCRFKVRLLKARDVSGIETFDLKDPGQTRALILQRYQEIENDLSFDDYFRPASVEEVESKEIKGRTWYVGFSGIVSTGWDVTLYTPLTSQHMLLVTCTRKFWPTGHKPSEKALGVSIAPLWDFMDSLYIDESPESVEPGVRDATNCLVREGATDETDYGW